VTTKLDKIALLRALKKPAITRQQLDQIISRAPKMTSPPTLRPPLRTRFLGYYKETTAFLADTIAVLPILGITVNMDSIAEWMHFWMVS